MALRTIGKDDLREHLDIVEVIGQYVRLQKAGNEWRGLCPFHDERTPSFYVNGEKGVWVCRGQCGEGGDVFAFVMKAENLAFVEAAELLASRLGYTLETAHRDPDKADQRARVLELCRLAAGLFERALQHGEGGEAARAYLTRRGLSDEIVARFQLGYAPAGWDALTRHLNRQGVSLADAEAAGLVKRRDRGDGYYDRFRGRVMFPIVDQSGRTVGFGGRVIDPHDEPKYLNSQDSPVFNKGRLLYGLPYAGDAIKDGAVVVEGYMDVIALHEFGVTNAVATMGTALTADHLKLLRRHTSRVTLCYDADKAGIRATEKAAAAFIEEGVEGRVLSLPDGQDPDEYVRMHGAEAFRGLLAAAPDLIDYRLEAALAAAGDEPTARSEAVREAVVAILADIRDEVRQAQTVRRVADWWSGAQPWLQNEMEATLRQALRQRRGRAAAGESARPGRRPRVSRSGQVERRLLRLLLHQRGHLAAADQAGVAERLQDPLCREVLAALLESGSGGTIDGLMEVLDPAARTLVADLACTPPEPGEAVERLLAEIEVISLEEQAEGLAARLAQVADSEIDVKLELARQLTNIRQQLEAERRRLLQPDSGGKR